jgi:hypothetical protein
MTQCGGGIPVGLAARAGCYHGGALRLIRGKRGEIGQKNDFKREWM